MLAGHNACAGAGRCGGTGQSWHSRRRMRGSGSIGRRQRVVIEVVHMQPQYTPATRAAACARTRRWTPAARDMAMRMLASRWCAEKSPMGSVTCSENNRGRAQGCLHASLFHPLTLFIHSHFENTHVRTPAPRAPVTYRSGLRWNSRIALSTSPRPPRLGKNAHPSCVVFEESRS